MKVHTRAMREEDIRECVDVIASHPVISRRYGPAIELLPEAWRRLLRSESHFTEVYFAGEESGAPVCCVGVTAVVHDDFINEIKAEPHFWIGPELTVRMLEGRSPQLTAKQLREANSGEGLNLVVWEGCPRTGYETHAQLHQQVMTNFIRVHQGYFWKEIIANQPESADRLDFLLRTGGALWDPVAGAYTVDLKGDAGEIAAKPHVVGTTRDWELRGSGNWRGSWVGTLFDYRPPVLGLNRSEQRLLSLALPGMTDEDLAVALETSLPRVKKLWASIYRRVEERLPEAIPGAFQPSLPASCRGREKRRGLLAYLRERPEELRPLSRKLVSKAPANMEAAVR
jgi:hypothetical protein